MHGNGHHSHDPRIDDSTEFEFHSGQRICCKSGNDQHQQQRNYYYQNASEEVSEESVFHNVRIVFKEPRIREMEHALGKHVKLFPERVQDHKNEWNQCNKQPEHCKENGNAPCDSAFCFLFPIINFFFLSAHPSSPPSQRKFSGTAGRSR